MALLPGQMGIGDFQAGPGPTLLSIPYGPNQQMAHFGVAICYEVIFPDLATRKDFLVITNDAWFGKAISFCHGGLSSSGKP